MDRSQNTAVINFLTAVFRAQMLYYISHTPRDRRYSVWVPVDVCSPYAILIAKLKMIDQTEEL